MSTQHFLDKASSKRGPKPLHGENMEAYSLRITKAQRERLDQLGGAKWIRDQIEMVFIIEPLQSPDRVRAEALAEAVQAIEAFPQEYGHRGLFANVVRSLVFAVPRETMQNSHNVNHIVK